VDFVSAELFDRHYFRVMVLHHGTIILDGTLETLQNMIGLPSLIRVKFRHPPCIRPLPEAERVEVRGEEAWISYDRRKASVPSILGAAGEWGEVEDVGMAEPDMEELIRRIYQEGETKIRDVGTVMADT
jgi:ABC-2 type transport system ATP-binding protein